MTRRRDSANLTMRGSVEAELGRLNDTELADIGLTRSNLGRGTRGLVIVQRGQRQRVLAAGSYRGLVSAVGAALLLILALLAADSRPSDHVALVSCPLFHPGMMGSASTGDAGPDDAWVRCQITTR